MINCDEINQTANEVLATLRKCKPVTNDVVIKLTELIIAINKCNEESEGLSALIPNWENRPYLQESLVFHNNSIWRNDCVEVTGEPEIDECWTLLAEINPELLWENISGDQNSVNISGFNNDSEFITLNDIPTPYFIYEQTTPSDKWTFQHPLNRKMSVTVTDSAGTVIEGQVTLNTGTEIEIQFNVPFWGYAYLI